MASPSSAIDFGQFRLRPALFFEFGQFDFGQFRLRPISTSANFDFGQFRLRPISISANFGMLSFGTTKRGALEGWGAQKVEAPNLGPEGWGPEGWGPEGGSSKGGGPKISRFFFPPPATVFFLLSLSWGPFVEFCWCLKRRGPEMCTFGVLGLSCASPGGPTRERKKNENCGGRREKKSEILGGPAEGCPAEGCPAEGCPAEGCPAEGCPAESLGFGVSGSVQVFGDENRNSTETK